MTTNEYANNYAENGLKVFPLAHNSKKPLPGSKGYLDATTDEFLLSEMFQNGANLGIATGRQSTLFVLDIDSKNDGKGHLKTLVQKFGGLPDTRTVETPSGGRHYYYLYPDDVVIRNSTGKIAPGIDVRGDGGYVVAPPSVVNGKKYNFLNKHDILEAPEWLIALIRAEKTHKSNEVPEVIQNGTRNERLTSLAGTYRKLGFSENEICERLLLDNNQKCKEPLSKEEVRGIAKSISRYERGKPRLHSATAQIQRATPSEFVSESDGFINNSEIKISSVCSDLLDLHLSDAGNAEALVKLYSRKLRFDHTSKQWFIWNGNTWEKDEKGNTKIYALRTARERLRSAADIEDKVKRKSLVNWCFQSESNFRINATLSIASTLEPLAVIKSEFDSDPMLLGCLNGVVNLSTGEFQEGNPEDMISLSTHIQFDESAKAPRWDRFLSEIFSQNEELINFVHRFVGYSLTGLTNEQIFAMLVGIGENGKSVFLAAVKNILGDYAANTPFSTFLSFKYDGNKISNEMAALAGKRFVTASEIKENMILNEGTIKAATGDDEITARFLNKNSFTFTPAFKLALCVNHKPKILDTTHAFWRRIKVIPFERKFSGEKRDNKLLDKLKNEAPGMLNWAIQGCLKWQTEGLKSPDIITAATKEYRTEEDVFKQFIEDCTCRGESAKVESAKLWEAWKTWAEKNGEKSQTNTWLGRKMKDEDGIIKERATIGGKKKTVYQGIGLLEESYEG